MSKPTYQKRDEPFPTDTYLRAHGWTLHDRPEKGPTMWESADRKRVVTEAEAVAEVDAEIARVEAAVKAVR